MKILLYKSYFIAPFLFITGLYSLHTLAADDQNDRQSRSYKSEAVKGIEWIINGLATSGSLSTKSMPARIITLIGYAVIMENHINNTENRPSLDFLNKVPSTLSELYKNRIRLNLTPVLYPHLKATLPIAVTLYDKKENELPNIDIQQRIIQQMLSGNSQKETPHTRKSIQYNREEKNIVDTFPQSITLSFQKIFNTNFLNNKYVERLPHKIRVYKGKRAHDYIKPPKEWSLFREQVSSQLKLA